MQRAGYTYLTAALIKRERSRRRATRGAIATLLVLGTAPVIAHHVAGGEINLLAGLDHVGALCLTALHLLLAPVHSGFHVLLLAGAGYALWDRLRAWRRTRQALLPLAASRPDPGDPFWAAAAGAGLDHRRLRIVEGLPVPALTIGLVRPLVYVGQDLAEELTEAELTVVLAHEGAHVARHDPLRLFALRLLACALFWLPAFRRLADDLADDVEIAADDRAAPGRPLVLATAILALARRRVPQSLPGTSLGFHHRDLLERRVRRLVGEDVAAQTHLTRGSLIEACVAVSLLWFSTFVVVHPLPVSDSMGFRPHCEHPAGSVLAHFFCLQGEEDAAHCPHATRRTSAAHAMADSVAADPLRLDRDPVPAGVAPAAPGAMLLGVGVATRNAVITNTTAAAASSTVADFRIRRALASSPSAGRTRRQL